MIKVQIIDDNVPATEILATYLNQDPDIKVINISADGKQGKNNYFKLKPDILILDLELPSMNGIEILDCICKSPEDAKRGLNVIALSEYFYKYKPNYTMKLHSCISKPYELYQIRDRIKEVYEEYIFENFLEKCRLSCYDIMTDLHLKPSNEHTKCLMEAALYIIEAKKTSFSLTDTCEKLSLRLQKPETHINWNLERAMRSIKENCTLSTFQEVFPNHKNSTITLKQVISLIANKLDPEHSYSEHTHCIH